MSQALQSHHTTVSSLTAGFCRMLYSHTMPQSQILTLTTCHTVTVSSWESPHATGCTVTPSHSLRSDSHHHMSQALQSQFQVWQSPHFTGFTVAVSSLTVTTFHRLYSPSLKSWQSPLQRKALGLPVLQVSVGQVGRTFAGHCHQWSVLHWLCTIVARLAPRYLTCSQDPLMAGVKLARIKPILRVRGS